MNMNDRVKQAVEDSHIWWPQIPHTQHMLAFWLLCLGGEVGELQNKAKKYLRGSIPTWEEARPILADELVDVFVYAFNVAAALGIDLEAEYNKKREHNDGRWNPDSGTGALAGADSSDSRS
jgi:NTP pyrophosphatase (non-canonical NTP hydrolase)